MIAYSLTFLSNTIRNKSYPDINFAADWQITGRAYCNLVNESVVLTFKLEPS